VKVSPHSLTSNSLIVGDLAYHIKRKQQKNERFTE
jgi:NIMA (never in mitosis gene a)-related kinase